MEEFPSKQRKTPQSRASSLEEKLRSQTRLLDTDKKILAENLGRICVELNPDKPLAAAMALIEKSQPNLRQKRKRYIRLPGEEASPDGNKGGYGSTGVTFAILAETASQMRYTSTNEALIARDKENTLRKLLRGSSLLPVYRPENINGRSPKDILDDYAIRLCESITKNTRITELWKLMESAKINLEQYTGDQLKNIGHPEYGSAQIVSNSLARDYFRVIDPQGEVRFSYAKEPEGAWEANPALYLGKIAVRRKRRIFRIPESVAPFFDPDEMDGDCFGKNAEDWLKNIGLEEGALPEVEFSHADGYGWQDNIISQIADIRLEAVNVGGKPFLSLRTYNSYRYAFGWMDHDLHSNEKLVVEGSNQLSNGEGDHDLLTLIWDRPDGIVCTKKERKSRPIGILDEDVPDFFDRFYNDKSPCWTDNERGAVMLMGNNVTFYPSIDESNPVGTPLHPGSVGAGLLANLQNASRENRIDKLLIANAKLKADAGINFVEAVLEKIQDALLKVGEE